MIVCFLQYILLNNLDMVEVSINSLKHVQISASFLIVPPYIVGVHLFQPEACKCQPVWSLFTLETSYFITAQNKLYAGIWCI